MDQKVLSNTKLLNRDIQYVQRALFGGKNETQRHCIKADKKQSHNKYQ